MISCVDSPVELQAAMVCVKKKVLNPACLTIMDFWRDCKALHVIAGLVAVHPEVSHQSLSYVTLTLLHTYAASLVLIRDRDLPRLIAAVHPRNVWEAGCRKTPRKCGSLALAALYISKVTSSNKAGFW